MKQQDLQILQVKKSLGILGCGWLGMATAKVYAAEGWNVTGTVRREESLLALKENGIIGELYTLGNPIEHLKSLLKDLDLLIIAIPPGLRSGDTHTYLHHLNILKGQLEIQLNEHCKVIFTSSTGVYPQKGGPFYEDSVFKPDTAKAITLIAAEEIIKDLPNKVCIVRFAGLVGPEREPLLSLAKRTENPGGNLAANLIEKEDAARFLLHIGQLKNPPLLLNAVYPQKIKKSDYYIKRAKLLKIKAPVFLDSEKPLDRHIGSKEVINFTFHRAV